MAKRKLTRQQAWRIKKVQEDKVKRSQRKSSDQTEQCQESTLGAEQTGLIISNYGASLDVEASDLSIWRCTCRQNIENLVVGDHVIWQSGDNGNGVIVALMPRQNILARPDKDGRLKALASNIDQIIVVASTQPSYDIDLINQYLVAAEITDIKPILLFNKIDLLTKDERQVLEEALEVYKQTGYQVIYASTKESDGLETLLTQLQEKTSVFAGQSGVGKSSLVNSLIAEAEIEVGEISTSNGLGKHTTSASRLYHLAVGGNIIDSPGVRDFRLWNITRDQLADGFIEFRPFLGNCRFRNCQHVHEPGCSLLAAEKEGLIDVQRLKSFYRIAEGLQQQESY